MNTIVESFAQKLPLYQAKKLEQILIEKAKSREIRTPDEFRKTLQQQLRELLSAEYQTIFTAPEYKPDDKILSGDLNNKLSQLEADLSSLIKEASTTIEIADLEDRKSTRLNSSHVSESRMPSSA